MPAASATKPTARFARWAHPLLAIAVFAVYLPTLARHLTASDGPEIVTAVSALGVIHPTGYPLFTMIGHAFVRLLPKALAPCVRLEIMNALAGAGAALFAALAARSIARDLLGEQERDAAVGGLFAGATLGTAPLVWAEVRVPEVYAFHLLLVAAAIWALVRFEIEARAAWVITASLMIGLGLAHHATIVYVLAPAVPFAIARAWSGARGERVDRRSVRRALVMAAIAIAAMAAPLVAYRYLLWATDHTTAIAWGAPGDWDTFQRHVTAKQYQRYLAASGFGAHLDRLRALPAVLLDTLAPAGAALAAAGLAIAARRALRVLLLLAAVLALNLLHGLYYAVPDHISYYLPALLPAAVLAGAALSRLLGWARSRGTRAWAAIAAASFAIQVPPAIARGLDLGRDEITTESFGREIAEHAPRGAVLLTLGDWNVSTMWYENHVEGRALEVITLDTGNLWTWWHQKYLASRFPAACDPLAPAFREDRAAHERACGSFGARVALGATASWASLGLDPAPKGMLRELPSPLGDRIVRGDDPRCEQASFRADHVIDACRCHGYQERTGKRAEDCVHAAEEGGVVPRSAIEVIAQRIIEDHLGERPVLERNVLTRRARHGEGLRDWDGPAYYRITGELALLNRGQHNEVVRASEVSFDPCGGEALRRVARAIDEAPRPRPRAPDRRRVYLPNEKPTLLAQSFLASRASAREDEARRVFDAGEPVFLRLDWFERWAYDAAAPDHRGAPIREGVRLCVFDPEGRKVATRGALGPRGSGAPDGDRRSISARRVHRGGLRNRRHRRGHATAAGAGLRARHPGVRARGAIASREASVEPATTTRVLDAGAVRRALPPLILGLAAFEILALTDLVPAPHAGADPARFTLFTAGAFAAAFILHLATRPKLAEIAVTLAVAGIIAALDLRVGPLVLLSNALGKASLAVLAVRAALATGEARRQALLRLGGCALLPLFLVGVIPALHLTAALHPTTYDGALYRLDAALGGQASFAVGRWFVALPWLSLACRQVYMLLPVALAALLVIPDREGEEAPRVSVIEAFVIAGALGFVVYHLSPACGPIYAFQATYPFEAPPAEDVAALPALLAPAPRNCVPSLHTAWALLLLWLSRPKGAITRAIALVWLVATELATLGLGEHYVVDLVIALPFAVLVETLAQHAVPWTRPERRQAAAGSAALIALWILAIRDPEARLAAAPMAARALTFATLSAPLVLRYRLSRCATEGVAPAPMLATLRPRAPLLVAAAAATTAAVQALVAGRWALLSIGSTPAMAALLLAAILGGLALGAVLAARARAPRAALGRAALAIAVWCGLAPIVMPALMAAHAALAPSMAADLALVLATTLPSSLAMGATLPLSTRDREDASAWSAATAAGAAVGIAVAGYVLLPALGLAITALAGTMPALFAALAAERVGEPEVAPAPAPARPPIDLERALVLAGSALVAGAAAVSAHLFTALAGASVYAVFAVLAVTAAGLALGAAGARAELPALLLGAAIAVLGSAIWWPGLPRHFASFDGYPLTRGFAEREAARLFAASITLGPIAVAAGAIHGRALGAAGAPLAEAARLLGAGLAAFVILPRAGALSTLHAIALVLAFAAIALLSRSRVRALSAAAAVGALLALQPARLDPSLYAAGSHAHFAHLADSAVLDVEERPFAVSTLSSAAGAPPVLAVNGAPHAHGAIVDRALDHARGRGEALVIGLGTGEAAAALLARGFARVVVAEPEPGAIALLLRRGALPGGIEIAPRDGRALLLGDRRPRDLVLLTPPPPWVAGAGSLWTRELFALARARLSPGGVIAARIDLDYLGREELAAAIGSARVELPEVFVHAGEREAVLVACAGPCPPEIGAEAPLLDPSHVNHLLARAGAALGGAIVSTDQDLRLELHAPRGNARDAEASRAINLAFLRGR